MIKISLSILAVYLMYYAGNILYDLFLKKEKEAYKEETQEFSLSEISDQYEELTRTIGIEDVENIITPKSFNRKELIPDAGEESNERQYLQFLKGKFESEQDLEELDTVTKNDSAETENQSSPEKSESRETYPEQTKKIINEQEIQKPNEVLQNKTTIDKDTENSRIKEWKKMLNLSETLVQMVANYDGHKVYNSTM
ncbi:hypothetical protein [Chryseobacterium turcicum]|uniref:Uncharacterized protein n=1 Tax=Chryseobacterium turcicum TaxID=2898076 RepID=A0A9Q3V382_9FLAO|nr:hypothetical protein [Chryseobacterium turcicum]MCD1117517.1 hypothetical protein [Chryseobacterium turcicum]